jgi:septal ring factor EnvC (AmiA/AmiB activator)
MSFNKEVFIIIGIIALGILITLGVEEIRFRSMKGALTTEIKILQGTNQDLQTKNGNLIEQMRTLKAQLEARTQKYERRISQLEEEVKTLQKKNQNLQAKNADLIEQMRTLKAQLETKIRIIPNE